MNSQTYIKEENKLKEEIILNYIKNSKSFKLFLKTLNNFEPLEGVTFSFIEKSKAVEREFNEEDLKRKVFSKKIEETNTSNSEIHSKIEEQMKCKDLIKDKDGYSYE